MGKLVDWLPFKKKTVGGHEVKVPTPSPMFCANREEARKEEEKRKLDLAVREAFQSKVEALADDLLSSHVKNFIEAFKDYSESFESAKEFKFDVPVKRSKSTGEYFVKILEKWIPARLISGVSVDLQKFVPLKVGDRTVGMDTQFVPYRWDTDYAAGSNTDTTRLKLHDQVVVRVHLLNKDEPMLLYVHPAVAKTVHDAIWDAVINGEENENGEV